MKRSSFNRMLALLVAFILLPAEAAVVHKWVDDKGVTHYSDQAPEAFRTEVTLIDMNESDPQQAAIDNNYYSIKNQWQRVYRERLERDKLKLEQARQKAAVQAARPRVVYINEVDDKRYVPVFYGAFHNRHKRSRLHRKYRHRVGYSSKRSHRRAPPGLHAGRNSQRSY